jgi:26S proteasome regulatory subunit N7
MNILNSRKALEQLKVTEGKTVATDQKMDLVFYTLQIGLFYMDFEFSLTSHLWYTDWTF